MKRISLIVITFTFAGCGLIHQMFRTPKSEPREYQVDKHSLYLEYFDEYI